MASPLPAHHTKHISQLQYPFKNSRFHLSQLDNGHSNGTALWLGAQCLSLYLADIYSSNKSPVATADRPRAIELGSGIGLTALALASMGWNVMATDLPTVINSVLAGNIERNIPALPVGCGSVQVRALDWTVTPDEWTWNHPSSIACASKPPAVTSFKLNAEEDPKLVPPFHLIITSDTVYSSSLVTPFLRTLRGLSNLSLRASLSNRSPPVYMCLERRDPVLTERTLSEAKSDWGFTVERVPHKKVLKAIKKGGITWDKADWEGVEIWKLT